MPRRRQGCWPIVVLTVGSLAVAACQSGGADRQVVSAGDTAASTTTSVVAQAPDAPAPVTTPSTEPTTAPTTATTRPPVTTTTRVATTTTTLSPTVARLTLINQHPKAVRVSVNGVTYTVGPGRRVGPVAVEPSQDGNDVISMSLVGMPSCGTGGAGSDFQGGAGRAFTLTIVASGDCPLDGGGSVPGPSHHGVQPG